MNNKIKIAAGILLLIAATGCANKMPEKLPGEDLMLAASPNWKYYAIVKVAVDIWGEDITLEPRIFRQDGMKNVLYFTGEKCRPVSTSPIPPEKCVNVVMGAAGNAASSGNEFVTNSSVIWINVEYLDYLDSIKKGASTVLSIPDPDYYTLFVVLHELGHFFGLDHSNNPTDLMFPDVTGAVISGNTRPTEKQKEEIKRNRLYQIRDRVIYVMM